MFELFAGYSFVLGAIIGSFLNVVIHRYPLGESIVFPPSRCPGCRARIKAWDNLPIISYLLLLGKCRSCKAPISMRYPLIELANGLLYLAIFLRTGIALDFLPLAAIASMTVVLIFIDLDIQILPDAIDLPGIAIGLLIGWMGAGLRYPDLTLSTSLNDSVIGAAAGAAIIWLIRATYMLIRKVEGMGLGDVKMFAMIGAVAGWKPLLPVLFIASVTGALFGVMLMVVRGEDMQVAIPFGVFLGFSTLTVLFFGSSVFSWYLGILI